MKKLSLGAIGVLALSVATVLVIRNLPDSNPQPAAAALPAATPASPVQLGGPAPSSEAKGDPGILKEIVRRYDERARARKSPEDEEGRARREKALAGFEDSMKEEPGVKKFGSLAHATLSPGETLLTGGWSETGGRHTLVFVTPTWIDAAGNKMNPPFNAAPLQLMVDTKFAQADDPAFEKLGLGNLFVAQNQSTLAVKISEAEFRSFIDVIEQTDGTDMLSEPRVTTASGCEARVSVQDERMIAGKKQMLGPSLDVLPTLSADGMSLDLEVTALNTMAASGAGQQ